MMLLVDRLSCYSKGSSDCLPRPPEGAGVVDMQVLELLDELSKTGDRGKADGRVAARNGSVETGELLRHGVSLG